ncbi:mevalonate kinase-like [Pogonomyrmex barbatus]|uniref:Mevalonate kinase-like n=1 Tax=Pogonomyrmex barbatus TaxID=144034 RepID=A0A8N1S818_9HYME|nr:mevalonate kinase-like [Pogonomyrmex barbatus]
MYRFNISAPGTVFLHGDTVLGYNGPCIAAALDIRTKLQFSSLPPRVVPNEIIRIEFQNLELHLDIPLEAFFEHFYDQNIIRKFSCYELRNVIEMFIESLNINNSTYDPKNEEHKLFLQAFLYLLIRTAYEEEMEITASIIVKLWTDLPTIKDLGTRTSFIVCLAACFWRWSLLQKGVVRYKFDSEDHTEIKLYAWNCEEMIYNSQSTINNFVSVYGTITVFEDENTAFTLDGMRPMKILMIDSNINQKMEMNQTEEMKNLCPCVDSIMSSIAALSSISAEAINEIFEKSLIISKNETNWFRLLPLDSYKTVSAFINVNQGLLKGLGMSNGNIDIICTIVRKYSLGCKITGNGRYVFILLLPNSTDMVITKLKSELTYHNFRVVETTMSCDGIRVE